MRWITVLALVLQTLCMFAATENDRPIIGILAQETSEGSCCDTYIPWNYVVYLESAGARVAPIRVKEGDDYYQHMFNSINGLLFPGGDVDIVTSEFAKAGRKFYDMALKANDRGDYFPLWGTCQGFEFLAAATAGENVMTSCSDMDISIPVRPQPGARNSRLLRGMSDDVYYAMTHWNITANFHSFCLLPSVFDRTSRLRNNFTVLSTNRDKSNVEFISILQGKRYPIYATQFHPEKNNMMWSLRALVNHTRKAVEMSQYFANFFVAEARKNFHHFPDIESESRSLIYNYQPSYSGQPSFEVDYYFNYSHHEGRAYCPYYHQRRYLTHSDGTPIRAHKHYEGMPHHTPTLSPKSTSSLDTYPLILMGLGMVACLIVGLQLGRCLEAHSHSETWPDVLSWMLHNQRHVASNRRPRIPDGPAGQRVKLLQTDTHYFTMEEDNDDEAI